MKKNIDTNLTSSKETIFYFENSHDSKKRDIVVMGSSFLNLGRFFYGGFIDQDIPLALTLLLLSKSNIVFWFTGNQTEVAALNTIPVGSPRT